MKARAVRVYEFFTRRNIFLELAEMTTDTVLQLVMHRNYCIASKQVGVVASASPLCLPLLFSCVHPPN